jgi:methionyl-tRNA synthetase
MAQLITILWRDIPAQVTAKQGRAKAAVQLTDRFQITIDRAAARAGLETTDEYLAEWRREVAECSDDLTSEANDAAERIEAEFTDEFLRKMVTTGGIRLGEYIERPDKRKRSDKFNESEEE